MQFDLEKEVSAARKFVLEKFETPNVKAAIAANLDISGSTEKLYQSGAMQAAFQRIMPIAVNFDDNGEIDVWAFNGGSDFDYAGTASRGNYAGFVQQEILNNRSVRKWGSTDYAPVMRANLRHFGYLREQEVKASGLKGLLGGSSQQTVLCPNPNSAYPTLVYHVTDGENSSGDRAAVRELLASCEQAGVPIYFHMIGIGNPRSFDFIEEIADQYGNVGFVNVSNVMHLADGADEVYELLLPAEMRGWFAGHFKR